MFGYLAVFAVGIVLGVAIGWAIFDPEEPY